MAVPIGGGRLKPARGYGGIAAAVVLSSVPLVWSGCAVRLEPVPRTEAAAGVRVRADPAAWSGKPRHLARHITPIEVTIENHSGRPLQVCYKDFALVSGTGFRYAAIPPYNIKSAAPPAPIRQPRFASEAFFVAPFYTPYYGDYVNVWLGSFDLDSKYYAENYSRWAASLPSRDMLEMAVPEGVLQPNGRLSGFLYFPELARGTREISFVATLIDAANMQSFGQLSVRFAVK